jgi:hypothetical protein
MKYILRESTGAFDLTRYEDYLEQQSGTLSAHVHGANLLATDRFVPTGPGSFHDARFERLLVATTANSESGHQSIRIELRLRGPYFDRYFDLLYEKVHSCIFRAPNPDDDLLMHEVRTEQGALTHELQFDKGNTIVISCREMHFVETLNIGSVTDESK